MSIRHIWPKIKNGIVADRETLVFSAILILVGAGAFGMGILAERSRVRSDPDSHTNDAVLITSDVALFDTQAHYTADNAQPSGNYFASRNGTAYYPLGCKAGDRVLAENRIYFRSMQEAELAGYKQSASCTF